MTHDMSKVSEIIGRNPKSPGSLIMVLQDIQKEFHYLPCEALIETSKELGVPLSKVFSVSTFYNAFSLEPRGEVIIRVCQGTACHIKNADLILSQLETGLKMKAGETSPDMKFTLEIVNCVGVCAMAPVVVINDKVHGFVRQDKVLKLVKKD
ncbi:NADH-quinone oxidoreductase subunit E [Candidatus Zixiibacteriota bacterium]|nr:NADH-quinone oxidoreductase subunit E [candidate division Zixibacteria bacterium]